MKEVNIPYDKNGSYVIFSAPDFEYRNPIDFYEECFIIPRVSIQRRFLEKKVPMIHPDFIRNVLLINAKKEWKDYLSELSKLALPQNFITILDSKNKSEQVKLLKDQSLNVEQLMSWVIRAWIEHGYTLSQFSVQHLHNGLDDEIIPRVVAVEGDSVDKVGATTLSNGQLKNLLKHRRKVVARILDRGSEWHCLFLTYKSLRGEESWKNGQPHFHYISDKFGMAREDVVAQLKSKHYKLNNLPHIDLIR